MNYNQIKSENTEHIKTIIKWLFDEVLSSSGDGDGIWYSNFFDINDIANFIEENQLAPKHFTCERHEDRIYYGQGEEWLIITNNEALFNTRPSWQQVALVY